MYIGWGRGVGWGGSKANTFSPYEEGGEIGYTGQEDLKFINSYNIRMGEKNDKGLVFPLLYSKTLFGFFCSCIPRPSLVLSALFSLGHHRK